MGLQISSQHCRETETETSVAWIDSSDCLKLINGIEGNRIVEDSCFYYTVLLWSACDWVSEAASCLPSPRGDTWERWDHEERMPFGGKRFCTVHGGTGRREESESWGSAACKHQRQTETETSQKVGNKHPLLRDNGRNIFHRDSEVTLQKIKVT